MDCDVQICQLDSDALVSCLDGKTSLCQNHSKVEHWFFETDDEETLGFLSFATWRIGGWNHLSNWFHDSWCLAEWCTCFWRNHRNIQSGVTYYIRLIWGWLCNFLWLETSSAAYSKSSLTLSPTPPLGCQANFLASPPPPRHTPFGGNGFLTLVVSGYEISSIRVCNRTSFSLGKADIMCGIHLQLGKTYWAHKHLVRPLAKKVRWMHWAGSHNLWCLHAAAVSLGHHRPNLLFLTLVVSGYEISSIRVCNRTSFSLGKADIMCGIHLQLGKTYWAHKHLVRPLAKKVRWMHWAGSHIYIYIYNLYNDMSTSTVTSNDRYICMCFHTFLLCLCLNVFADVIVGYVD